MAKNLLVSNDYLGFSQHPLIKEAAITGLMKYGTGASVSPVIGTLRAATDLFKEVFTQIQYATLLYLKKTQELELVCLQVIPSMI